MKFIQSVLFALISLAVSGRCFILQQNQTDKTSKIEDGDSVCIRNVPYQVILKFKGHYFCGGALIKPNFVLTAAHCVKSALASKSKLSVVAGTDRTKLHLGHSIIDRRIKIAAEHIEMHPHYYKRAWNETAENDLALIKLAENVPLTKRIKPISLPKQNVKINDELTLAGIGKLNFEANKISPCLKFYKPKVIDCMLYGQDGPNVNGIFCHKSEFGQRTHQGDSGGPMVNSNNELVGIHVSSSPTNLFQIATNVHYYLDWIHGIINKDLTNEVWTDQDLSNEIPTNPDLSNDIFHE